MYQGPITPVRLKKIELDINCVLLFDSLFLSLSVCARTRICICVQFYNSWALQGWSASHFFIFLLFRLGKDAQGDLKFELFVQFWGVRGTYDYDHSHLGIRN